MSDIVEKTDLDCIGKPEDKLKSFKDFIESMEALSEWREESKKLLREKDERE